MHGDGAEEAESRRGAMPATEHHGKLCAVCQRMLGGLRNVTVFPHKGPHPEVPKSCHVANRKHVKIMVINVFRCQGT